MYFIGWGKPFSGTVIPGSSARLAFWKLTQRPMLWAATMCAASIWCLSATIPGQARRWNGCALEIQAVYFSGNAMRGEFKAFAESDVDWVIFPAGRRRPDYRSSAPKRLMPQLQIKVPTLRRWGKKMAVVVDRAFFDSVGEMDKVEDISNADIAWFIVRFEEIAGSTQSKIVRDEVRYTTLERSVEGLTGGKAVPKSIFEERISGKLNESPSLDQAEESGLPDGGLSDEIAESGA